MSRASRHQLHESAPPCARILGDHLEHFAGRFSGAVRHPIDGRHYIEEGGAMRPHRSIAFRGHIGRLDPVDGLCF